MIYTQSIRQAKLGSRKSAFWRENTEGKIVVSSRELPLQINLKFEILKIWQKKKQKSFCICKLPLPLLGKESYKWKPFFWYVLEKWKGHLKKNTLCKSRVSFPFHTIILDLFSPLGSLRQSSRCWRLQIHCNCSPKSRHAMDCYIPSKPSMCVFQFNYVHHEENVGLPSWEAHSSMIPENDNLKAK